MLLNGCVLIDAVLGEIKTAAAGVRTTPWRYGEAPGDNYRRALAAPSGHAHRTQCSAIIAVEFSLGGKNSSWLNEGIDCTGRGFKTRLTFQSSTM